eukprot:scaffold42485_cov50-Attheya_sp.AAC.6
MIWKDCILDCIKRLHPRPVHQHSHFCPSYGTYCARCRRVYVSDGDFLRRICTGEPRVQIVFFSPLRASFNSELAGKIATKGLLNCHQT